VDLSFSYIGENTLPDRNEIKQILSHLESYLSGTLLPFWLENAPDLQYGGFLSYFDRYGQPTGETTKPFLMQIRMLYTLSSTHRFGYGGGRCAELAYSGARFIADHYWDAAHDGWFWIADRGGTPTVMDKVGYGHCFGIYAFSEYFLATGDPLGKEMALRSYDAVCRHMADTRYGGYLELLDREWRPQPPGPYGGDRKSLDVHMHMMEALTSFYAMSGLPSHRRRLQESIDLILTRMLNQENGLGLIQFTYDFQPLRRIIFATEWGRDAHPVDQVAAPIDQTSPGHNVELAWLLLHAADTLGTARETYAPVVRRLFDHAVEFGIDPEYGGVYADTLMARPTQATEKQFWQQAEVLIGMLDAYSMFHEEKYWQAFRNVYDFVFNKMVVMPSGEWVERVDRAGQPIDAVLGHAWKINYHTVRSMVQTIQRLRALADAA
jgi:mannose/cellobiose epimerase-like protein (N-acyl-D-glucosamine 2-epimerase family)